MNDSIIKREDGDLIFERLLVTGTLDKPYYEIEYIENGKHYTGYSSYKIDVISQYLKDYFGINSMPAKRGHWVLHGDNASCSLCNGSSGTQFDGVEPVPRLTAYCPHCGADMRKAKAEEEGVLI